MKNIKTVCNVLRTTKNNLKCQLENISNGRSKKGKKEILENQLVEIEEVLRVFEYFEE